MAVNSGDGYDRDILDIIPERFDADVHGLPHPERERVGLAGRLRTILTVGAAVVAVGGIVAVGWHFVVSKRIGGTGVPVIKADERPIKMRPDDRGGMQVPNQDKLVYERMEAGEGDAKVERLLPPPEQPVVPVKGQIQPDSMLKPPAAKEVLRPNRNGAAESSPPPVVAEAPTAQASAPAAPAPVAMAPRPIEPLPPPAVQIPAQLPVAPAAPAPVAAAAPAAAPSHANAYAPVQNRPAKAEAPVAAAAPPRAAPQAPAVKAAAAPPPAAKVASAPASPPAASQSASVKPTAGGEWLIQLGAVRSAPDAEKEWGRIQRANSDMLSALKSDIARVELGEKGTFWRLRAGPLTEQSARQLCSELKNRSQGCIIARK